MTGVYLAVHCGDDVLRGNDDDDGVRAIVQHYCLVAVVVASRVLGDAVPAACSWVAGQPRAWGRVQPYAVS